jgi:[acyl-carrier-protein] S-malonyltransferase
MLSQKSSIAFTFPGQGSQAVGMGKALYDASAAARAVFAEVDEALGQKLSTLLFEGPEDELTLTANAQPALMAVSMAAMAMLNERGLTVDKAAYVAGHSLGEYSALCAAGMFSLSDTAKLLRIRGNAMQAAVPVGAGAMAAIIGAEAADVAKLCADSAQGQICQIANDNGGGQLVISGSAAAIARAIEGAAAIGAKRAIPLSVSAPFHSALMQPAADAMREALAKVARHSPRVPVIANVTVSPLTDPETIAAKLVEQVTGQVRWRETVEWFAANNITTLYEIGSGKVLTGLAKRISKDVVGVAVNTPEDIEALAVSLG